MNSSTQLTEQTTASIDATASFADGFVVSLRMLRRLAVGTLAGLLAVTVGACTDSSVSPVSPAPVDAIDQVVSSSELVTSVRAASGRPYVAVGGLRNESRAYVDRVFKYQAVPAALRGLTHILTGNGDQAISTAGTFLSFELSQRAVVFVAYQGVKAPAWLTGQGFRPTGDTLSIAKAKEARTYVIHSREFAPGRVELGSNRASGGNAEMYTVMVKPVTSAATGLVSAVTASSGRPYRPGYGLADGDRVYVDRTYSYEGVPARLQGAEYVLTANGDQAISGDDNFLSFTLAGAAVVHVAVEGKKLPTWMQRAGFKSTGESVVVAKKVDRHEQQIYAREFPAGRVRLGSNQEAGRTGQLMYSVIVQPSTFIEEVDDGGEKQAIEAFVPLPSDYGAVVRGIRPRGFGQGVYSLVAPANGASAYFVAVDGNDSNPGTHAAPFRTINKAAQIARAGDVVSIRPGVYRESVQVRNGGTAERPIVFQATGRGEVILTGGKYNFAPAQYYGGVKQNGAIHVTLRGLVFRTYAPEIADFGKRAAVGAIRGWRIEDCLFTDAGYVGVDVRGDSVTILRSTFEDHHTLAISAMAESGQRLLAGTTLVDVILRRNNHRPDPLSGETATKVLKFYRTTGTVVDNVESYENNGPGLWFDTDNTHYVVRNSYLHHNKTDSGRGLFLEVSNAPGLVEHNVFAGNEVAGIAVANSRGVEIKNNLFLRNRHEIDVINAARGSYQLYDVNIHHNSFKGWRHQSAIQPGGVNISTPARMAIKADYNTYDPGTITPLTFWTHTGWIRTIEDMRFMLAWERNGRIAPVQDPS